MSHRVALLTLGLVLHSVLPVLAFTDVTEDLRFGGDPSRPVTVRVMVPPQPLALVVYTHGFLDNHRNHQRLYNVLLSRGYAVATWDLLGHGTSFGMRGHVERFDDYATALQMVREHAVSRVPTGTPVFMLGHSLGALVTLLNVEQHPEGVAGSAYLAPFLEARMSPVRKFLNSLSGLMDHIFPKLETPHGVTNEMMFRSPEILAERRRDPFFFPKITVHLFRQMEAGIAAVNRGAARITAPLLFLVAGDEQVVVRKATDVFFAKLAGPKATQAFESARHELHSDVGRERVLAALTDWIRLQLKERSFRALHPAR